MTETPAFQDLYPDAWSHCYGCGRLNERGLRVRSFWEGDQTVAVVIPRPAPQLGEHSEEILRSILGYPGAQVDALRAARVVGTAGDA